MAENNNDKEKAAANRFPEQDQVLGASTQDMPYDLTVAGDADESVWDNMVNAVKPELTPKKKKG